MTQAARTERQSSLQQMAQDTKLDVFHRQLARTLANKIKRDNLDARGTQAIHN